ncbi:glycosyltransferase [Leuconostoc lactis]|uniref:glycosyltransferase n=1 Tax=Leuconostoc lactis TaxID=1246 RepID=UPI0028A0E1CD|nr:glycosyltransferase [Leuconostoc lactis]
MTGDIFLSVIVPVYNVEGYIEKCYQSINQQKIKNIEIIFVNDNSTDRSLEILTNLSKNDDRVFIINKTKNDDQGAGSSRNLGIEKSHGKYLYFMDADDYLADDAFEILKNTIEIRQSQVILFGFTAVLDDTFSKMFGSDQVQDDHFSFSTVNERVKMMSRVYFANNLYVVWNKVYLRDFIINKNIKFPNNRTAQDAFFNIDVFKHLETFSWISNQLYYYIVNRKNSNQNTIKSKFLDEYKLLKQLELLTNTDVGNIDLDLLINSERLRIAYNEIEFSYVQNPKLVKELISNNAQLRSVIQEIDFKIFLKDRRHYSKIIYYVLFRSKVGLAVYSQLRTLKILGN